MYPNLESAIIAQLGTVRTTHGIAVGTVPETPNEWGEPAGAGWCKLIFSEGTPMEVSRSLGDYSRRDCALYTLDIRTRKLRAAIAGLYQVMRDVGTLLHGWKPAHTEALKPLYVGKVTYQGLTPDKGWHVGRVECWAEVVVVDAIADTHDGATAVTDIDYQVEVTSGV